MVVVPGEPVNVMIGVFLITRNVAVNVSLGWFHVEINVYQIKLKDFSTALGKMV